MIKIPSTPTVLSSQLLHDDFFFASRSRKNILVKDLSIIVNKDDYDQYVCAVPKNIEHNGTLLPFYLQHTDLFNNAQKIFEQIFSVSADLLLIYAYKNDLTKSSFLFSNKNLIEEALRKQVIKFPFRSNNGVLKEKVEKKIIKEQKNERNISNIKIAEEEIFYSLPKGVFPVIGAFNALHESEKHPNFNLIFGSLYSDQFYDLNRAISQEAYRENDSLFELPAKAKKNEWEFGIDSFVKNNFKRGLPLYCVKKFDLKNEYSFTLYDPTDMTNFFNKINQLCVDDFIDSITNLLLGYSRGNYLPLDNNAFECCMPHFYNVDRTEQTVAKKPALQVKLKELYDVANDFGKGKPDLCFRHFIEFFILESMIDLENFKINPGEEINNALIEKRTIKQLIGESEILKDFLTKDTPNSSFNLFVNNQIEAKRRIIEILYST